MNLSSFISPVPQKAPLRAKRQTRVGKDIGNTHNYQRAHLQIYKEQLEVKKISIKKWARNLNKFFKKRIRKCLLTKHKKKLSTSLAIREKCKLNQ